MAELGAIASVVQLVDVTLRVSGEIRSFLDAYKDTGSDVKALRDALRDVEANVRNLVKYTAEFKKSKNAVEEFEVLSETIINSLKGYDQDVLAAKRLLPQKPTEKIKEKVHWVLHKQKAGDLTRRLNERNGSLNTALGIAGGLHDLRLRQDTTRILDEQAASRIAASKQLDVLNQSIQKQENNHAELLSQSRTISSKINAAQASSTHEHEAIASGISRQSILLNRKLSQIDNTNSLMARRIQKASTTLGGIQSQAQRMTSQYTQSVKSLAADVHEIHTQTTFIASSVNMTTKILREELRTTLKPIVEQAFTTSNLHNETKMQRMEDLIRQITHNTGNHAHAERPKAPFNITNQELESSRKFCDNRFDQPIHQSGTDFDNRSMTKFGQYTETGRYNMISTYKRRWLQKWKIGSLEVEITQVTRRTDGSPHSNSTMSIQVHFRPSESFLHMPGMSVLFSTAPNSQGYYQLAPMIATIPIIEYKHPVIDVLIRDDVEELQSMLATGEVHLRCQEEDGWTLLHWAAKFGALEACKFLTLQGLSWHQSGIKGRLYTPAHMMLNNILQPLSSAPMEALRFLGSIGNNTENTLLELTTGYALDVRRMRYSGDISEFCQTIRFEWTDTWRHLFVSLAESCFLYADLKLDTLPLFELLLTEGLDPNSLILAPEYSYPLLWSALNQVEREKKRRSAQAQSYNEEYGIDSSSSPDITVQPWCMIKALLKSGVDIYYMDPEDFDKATVWYNIDTYCMIAARWGVVYEWKMALEECGLDHDKVCSEDVRHCKQAIRLRGANRSGVDENVLELPSIDGLRCRICRRMYCARHGINVFDESERLCD